jgi:hypothetical protein
MGRKCSPNIRGEEEEDEQERHFSKKMTE